MVAPSVPLSWMADEVVEPSLLTGAPPMSDLDYVLAMERLLHAVQELSLARTLPEVQRIVRTSARELVGCDGATFVLRDNGKCYYADEDAIEPLWKGSRFPMEICISGWTMLNRRAVVIPDIYLDDRIPHAAYRPTFVKSLVMVPIRQLAPVGAIGAYWADRRQPSSREVALLQALADSTSIAMEHVQSYSDLEQRVRDRTADLEKANEEIRQLSLTDELTELNNRRGFWLLAEPALRAARSGGRDCLLAFLDVDGLKEVNDGDGHDVGDALICDTAQIMRAALHSSDIVGRLGGDEFCVLVTESDGDPTAFRSRLLDAFTTFNATGLRPYRLSVSMGLLCVPAAETATLDELLVGADALMYEDKKTKGGASGARHLSFLRAEVTGSRSPARRAGGPWHDNGMNRIRLSTTVDAVLLSSARDVRAGITDAALIDEALESLLTRHRSAEVDASYAAYDKHPIDEPDEWGDLASWRRAAGDS